MNRVKHDTAVPDRLALSMSAILGQSDSLYLGPPIGDAFSAAWLPTLV